MERADLVKNVLATIIDEKHNEVRALAGATSFAALDQAAKAASPVVSLID